jgi:hypothetical protein
MDPINLLFHPSNLLLRVFRAPRRACAQVWDSDSGEGFTNIEPGEADINDVCVWPRSGLIMVGCDSGAPLELCCFASSEAEAGQGSPWLLGNMWEALRECPRARAPPPPNASLPSNPFFPTPTHPRLPAPLVQPACVPTLCRGWAPPRAGAPSWRT